MNVNVAAGLIAALLSPAEMGKVFVRPDQEIPLSAGPAGGTVLAALDGGLVREVAGPLKAPPESGEHWLFVVVRGASGETSGPRWIRLHVDGDAPDLKLALEPPSSASPSGTVYTMRGARAVVTATDPGSGLGSGRLQVGDREVPIPPSGQVSYPLPEELTGELSLSAEVVDRAGNQATRSLVVAVDTLPPQGEVWVTGPRVRLGARLIASPAATVTSRWVDEGCGLIRQVPYMDGAIGAIGELTASAPVVSRLESAPLPGTTPELWQGPWTPGVHVAEADGYDCAGNQTRIGPLEFEIDHDPPRIVWERLDKGLDSSSGDSYVRNPFRIQARAYDTLAGLARFQWSCGGRWETAGRDVEQLGLEIVCSAGDVLLRAEDRVGNRRDITAFVRIDNDPPVLRVSAPGSDVSLPPGSRVPITTGQELLVTAEDPGVGLGELWYSVDGGAARRLDGRVPFASEGRFALEIRALDRLGNEVRASFKVDVTPAPARKESP